MTKRLTRDEIIRRFREVHGDRYDYSRMIYLGYDKEVEIGCPIHGWFWQLPYVHLRGCGCKLCADAEQRKTLEQFVIDAEAVHGKGRYDYSLAKYKNNKTKLKIICHVKDENGVEHGVYEQTPDNHINNGTGCPFCAGNAKKDNEQFIKEAKDAHPNEDYDYSESEYDGAHTKLKIICHKKDKHGVEHGAFWQTPHNHIYNHSCCPKCKQSKLEAEAKAVLDRYNISYEAQCGRRTFAWLGRQSFDIYLTSYNVAIECQGEQHYRAVEQFGGEEGLKIIIERDKRKAELCEENGVRLFYIRYDENVDEAVTHILELIGMI